MTPICSERGAHVSVVPYELRQRALPSSAAPMELSIIYVARRYQRGSSTVLRSAKINSAKFVIPALESFPSRPSYLFSAFRSCFDPLAFSLIITFPVTYKTTGDVLVTLPLFRSCA
jgi:hypothetical protein